MKKITIALAVFSAVCLKGFSQTVVDLGWNWNGTFAVAPVSGAYLEGAVPPPTHNQTPTVPFAIYPGTDNEVFVTCIEEHVLYKFWAGDLYAVGQEYGCIQIGRFLQKNYIEVSLTANSANKKITAAKLNGTSSSLDMGTNFVVIYSDACPFDEQRVVSYNDTYEFPASRSGSAEITLDIPEKCKSFRIYRRVLLEQISLNPVLYEVDGYEMGSIILASEDQYINANNNARFGYFSVTLENDNSSNISVTNADKAVIATEYFDVTGKKVTRDFEGLIFVKRTYIDGSSDVEKLLNR